FELLLVDDGSTDDSRQIARANVERDPRLRLLQHDGGVNRGKAASRNLGLQEAQGVYVVFLDADDILMPEKLARQVRLLLDNPRAEVVIGRTLYWYSDADPAAQDRLGEIGWAPGRLFEPPDLMVLLLRKRGLVPCLCSPMIALDLVRRLGGFELAIPDLFEDQVLLAKVFLAGTTLTDDFCGEKYRQHPGSSSARAAEKGAYHPWRLSESERHFVEWLAGYVDAMAYDDPALRRAVAHVRRRFRYPRIFGGIRRVAYEAHRLRQTIGPHRKTENGSRQT
ncbi:MAG TPA: glycosyltransferase family A protein, partial [Kiloniellaceae bacterium]|nr:glycosyltransferase family A protein [Kiloniellaceae bacterium]